MTKLWYHFTTRDAARKIVHEGLRPRGDRSANYHGEGLDSNPSYVYLTSRPVRPWHCFDYDNAALLVIDSSLLDTNLMREDEDAAKFGTAGTAAYEGVIDADAIEDVQFFLPVKDERGGTAYVRVQQDFRDWEI
jgi:hypothetical protein